MIVISSYKGDLHVERVLPQLKAKGIRVAEIFWEDVPTQAHLSVEFPHRRRFRSPSIEFDWSEVQAIWSRKLGNPSRPDPFQHLKNADCQILFEDWMTLLERPIFPASMLRIQLIERKTLQFQAALECGLNLPETLITNDFEEALEFYSRHDGAVISKPLFVKSWRELGRAGTFTQAVNPQMLRHVCSLDYGPTIFQKKIAKRTEIRITVVGDRLFPVEIDSQASHRTTLDFRHYDFIAVTHREHQLPPSVAEQVLELQQALGLRYGAIDMIVTDKNEYVFLEVNPTGEWLWLENLTGINISGAVADYLIQMAQEPYPKTEKWRI